MTSLLPAGSAGSITNPGTQNNWVEQFAALLDGMRQIVGDARVVGGDSLPSDPLNAAFELYVDPVRGVDTFAHGEFNSYDPAGATVEEQIENKLRRIANQRLVCGYTPQRPFRTVNRAAIEAAIITSRSWFINDPKTHVDCILIHLSAGVHIVYNNPGTGAVAAWADGYTPSVADLIAFNPPEGGVIIPRYASIQGANLRKCTLRPNYVPPVQDEAADYGNRSTFFRVTPGCLSFGFSFFDSWDEKRSHHLLDCFHFASETQLNSFYSKVNTACTAGASLDAARLVARPTEYAVVSPAIDQSATPTADWDVVSSASAYIYNCSIRSEWGMGGIFADGSKVEGLKSMVTAQFTGVSLQRDLSCWQVYKNGSWVAPANYAEYISAAPDDVRMNPARMSRHITAVNDAFIQEVSVFAIGQGIHHYTDDGGEITITNSNSSFGGCAAISKGYKGFSFPQDSNWAVSLVRTPRTVAEKTGNIKKVFLGAIASVETGATNAVVLELALAESPDTASVPAILRKDGYSFRQGSYLWVENPSGPDWRAPLPASAWTSADPARIALSAALARSGDGAAVDPADLIDRRVYIRRLVDTRTTEERRTSLEIVNTATARRPETNFVLQTDPERPNGAISAELAKVGEGVLLVSSSGKSNQPIGGVRNASLTIRRGANPATYTQNAFYRAGTVVRFANKHYQATKDLYASGSTPNADWVETFVHMASGYQAEDVIRAESPILVFDFDSDPAEITATCGIDWGTIYTGSGPVRDQLRTGTDYVGVYTFLRQLGFSDAAAHTALTPKPETDRNLDPSSAVDFPTAPSGGVASGLGNWAIEFRRPSVLRLYGHAWEWAGWLNYSKSIPGAQQQLSALNKFTYYFTHENGGRVVPQGSNEDGFNVSPRGLESIETGETLSIDNLDFPDIDVPDVFNNLLVNNLAVEGVLDFSGVTQSIFPDGLFPFLPNVGDPQAEIVLKALGIGTPATEGFELTLQGAANANFITLTGSTIDCREGNYFVREVAGNVTFSFTNPPPTGRYEMVIDVLYTSGAITLPTSARYLFGLLPVLVAGNRYQFICNTINGGTTWSVVVLEFPQ